MIFKKVCSEMISVKDGELYIEKIGQDKPPIILIHAGFSDRRDWTHQFAEFGKKYFTVAYDQRGFGKSTAITSAFSPAGDLRSVVEHLKIEKACLIGHSIGGTIALDFALQFPDKVSALVLIASGMNGYAWSNEYMELMGKTWNILEPKIMTKAFLSAYFYDMAMSNSNINSEIYKITKENFEKVLTWTTFDVKDVHWYFSEPLIKLQSLKIPALLIYGDKDSSDIKNIAHILNKHIPCIKTKTIKNADHLLNFEKPAELNALILDFLNAF